MEYINIISKVDQVTGWVCGTIVAEKRIWWRADMLGATKFNKAIMREHHHIPALDEISHKFAGLNIFTIMT